TFLGFYLSQTTKLSAQSAHSIRRGPASEESSTSGSMTFGPGTINMREGHSVGNSSLFLEMQTDGNLVLYTSGGKALWSSGTWHQCTHCRAAYQTDGNLVVYDVDTGKAIFSQGYFSIALTLMTTSPYLDFAMAGTADLNSTWNVNLSVPDHPM